MRARYETLATEGVDAYLMLLLHVLKAGYSLARRTQMAFSQMLPLQRSLERSWAILAKTYRTSQTNEYATYNRIYPWFVSECINR